MGASDQFSALMAGFQAGDPAATESLFQLLTPVLQVAVRNQLPAALRPRFDSLDFVQDVWASVLALPHDRRDFPSPDSLRRFLTKAVLNKVAETCRRRFGTEKYDIRREQPLDNESRNEPLSRGPTPSQLAVAGETWERLVSQFPVGHRTVLARLREGYGYEDIACLTGVSASTIKRIVRRLKEIVGTEANSAERSDSVSE